MLSAYGQQDGADTNQEFQDQGASTITHAASCQDCHMREVTGAGCDKSDAPNRPSESIEHPNSGLPLHDLTGGNAWVPYVLASAIPGSSNYDATNGALLNQGSSALTLNLTQGEGINPTALLDGADRAKQQLQLAASILDTNYYPATGNLSFTVQNNTGHKLISGFPEGRRMFINIKAYVAGNLIYEVNPYDDVAGTLKGLSYPYLGLGLPDPVSIGPNEIYIDELVYEMHPSSIDLTGEQETFHFALATSRYKDNRIPPKGFRIAEASDRLSVPVWHGVEDPNFFSPEEYAGGYDQVSINIPAGATKVEIELYYQTTSREYIEFLRDEINGTGNLTLSSPSPSGESQAYIIQTDPFFTQMKAWGDTIWNLWTHNMDVDGAAPILMTSVDVDTQPIGALLGTKFMDLDEDGINDPHEIGLLGWEINLAGNSLDLTVYTDGDGNYSFENIPYGTYTLTEVMQSGWYQTYPGTGSWIVIVEEGNDLITNLNFGNTPSYKEFLPVVLKSSSP
jgi:hypothetical protein